MSEGMKRIKSSLALSLYKRFSIFKPNLVKNPLIIEEVAVTEENEKIHEEDGIVGAEIRKNFNHQHHKVGSRPSNKISRHSLDKYSGMQTTPEGDKDTVSDFSNKNVEIDLIGHIPEEEK
jgi:hypothetical protein